MSKISGWTFVLICLILAQICKDENPEMKFSDIVRETDQSALIHGPEMHANIVDFVALFWERFLLRNKEFIF